MRECGSCTACCMTHSVPSLGKKAGERCAHLTEQGCGIYETRPPECRSYFCLWADEKAEALDLPEWSRPDRIGIVLNAQGHDLNKQPVLIAAEVEKGASRSYWVGKLMNRTRLKPFAVAVRKTT